MLLKKSNTVLVIVVSVIGLVVQFCGWAWWGGHADEKLLVISAAVDKHEIAIQAQMDINKTVAVELVSNKIELKNIKEVVDRIDSKLDRKRQ